MVLVGLLLLVAIVTLVVKLDTGISRDNDRIKEVVPKTRDQGLPSQQQPTLQNLIKV